jgi:hypothetical protein
VLKEKTVKEETENETICAFVRALCNYCIVLSFEKRVRTGDKIVKLPEKDGLAVYSVPMTTDEEKFASIARGRRQSYLLVLLTPYTDHCTC